MKFDSTISSNWTHLRQQRGSMFFREDQIMIRVFRSNSKMKFKKNLTSTIRIKSCKTQRYNMNSKLQLININKSISQLTLINFLLKIIQKSKCRQICKNPLNNCSNLPQFSLRMFKMMSLRVIRSNLWRILLPPINMKNLIRMNKVKDSLKNLPSQARRILFNNSHNYKGKIPNK